MRSIFFSFVLISSLAANASSIELDCIGKAISKVNVQHTLAEGSTFAVKVLHKGVFGAALLVGHSDETDPTDYLVVVDTSKKACKIASITVADEAGDVNEYGDSDVKLHDDAVEAYQKSLVGKGLDLMKSIPSSGYDVKLLCIRGEEVTARVPMTHWAKNDRKTMTGSLSKFPSKTSDGEPAIKISSHQKSVLVEGTEHNGIVKVRAYVNDQMADICLMEVKPVLE